jgi:hypothetical protein
MNNNQAGKGDKPRPVDKKQFNNNFDQISWNSKNSAEQKKVKNKTVYIYK